MQRKESSKVCTLLCKKNDKESHSEMCFGLDLNRGEKTNIVTFFCGFLFPAPSHIETNLIRYACSVEKKACSAEQMVLICRASLKLHIREKPSGREGGREGGDVGLRGWVVGGRRRRRRRREGGGERMEGGGGGRGSSCAGINVCMPN